MTLPAVRRRAIAIAAAILAVAGLSAYVFWSGRALDHGWPLMLYGNVEVRQVNLGFKVAGRIASLGADEGDRIEAGQRLASLDKVYFEETLAQLKAQREQMAANLAKLEAGNRPEDIAQAEALVREREATVLNAKITADRAEKLLKTSAGTQKTYDDAMAAQREADARLNSARNALRLMQIGFRKEDIEAARAQLADRDAAINIADRQLKDAELIAPSPGVVLSRVREKGAIVNAGDTIFILSLTSPVWVRSYVSEPDLERIHPGMEVEISTDMPGGSPLKGRIGFISTTAEFTPKSVETRELRTALVYRLRIVVDDAKGLLRQGMPVTVTIPGPGSGKVIGSDGSK